MSRLLAICCIVAIAILVVGSLTLWHKIALDEAQRQATIKMLSSFHKDYLRSTQIGCARLLGKAQEVQ